MMSGRYGNSSDAKQARALAERLHTRFHENAARLPVPSRNVASQKRTSDEVSVPELRFDEVGVYRQDVWAALLDWSLQVAQASSAFVADQRGLVIALKGKGQGLDSEIAASVFASVLGQLKVLCLEQGMPRVTMMDSGEHFLTVLSVGPTDQSLLVGFSSDAPIEYAAYLKIAEVFNSKLEVNTTDSSLSG